MSNRILYTQNGNTGKLLAQAVNAALVARDEIRRVRKILDAASAGDFTGVAAELGGITVQEAQDAWAIVSNASAKLDDPAVAELSRLDQG